MSRLWRFWLAIPVVLLSVVFLQAGVALASGLPEIEAKHITEIEQWVYRGAGIKDPLPCGETCILLWNAERRESAELHEFWDQLGVLYTEKTHLWGSLAKLHQALNESGSFALGASPIEVGWHIGNGEGAKWMGLVGPQEPVESIGCGTQTTLILRGEEVDRTTYSNPLSPGNEWYLIGCNNSPVVAEYAYAENLSQPENKCNKNGFGFLLLGWTRQEWQWNLCGEGFYEGKEVLAPIYADGFYQQFHFSKIEDWTGQKLEGEFARNVQTVDQSDPGQAEVRLALEETIGGPKTPVGQWVMWVLEGEKGANPLRTTPSEEYGPSSPSMPGSTKCFSGKPVNCATGNEVESQTDLSVGGRGPGLRMTRTYNAQLAAKQITPGVFGYGWTGSYSAHVELNAAQNAATIVQDDGSTVGFLKSGEKWVPANPLGQAIFVSEEGGYLYTLPDQTTLHFNTSGQLVSETDRNGNNLTMSHNGEGRLESVSDPAGRKLTFAYNTEGQVESVTDPMGHVVKYSYEAGNLARVTLPGEVAANSQFKYDSLHRLTGITDGRGGKTTNEYDSENRVISQTDPMERTLTFQYEPSRTTITNKATGAVTDEHFSSDNEPVSVTHGYGTASATTTEMTYDSAGNLASVTDGNKHTTKYEYDSANDRVKMVDPDGHETKWTYDSTHDVETVTTPKGETATITRDSHGNAETVSRPAPGSTTQITTYKYDSHGNIESVEDPLKRVWKYEYDSAGDRTAEIDPEGDKRTWGYNEDSQQVSMTSPRGSVAGAPASVYTSTIERDARGRSVTVTEPPREPSYNSAFGSSGSGNGQFQFPTLEALTSSGDLWVSDSTLNRVQEFNEKGEYVTQFGSTGTGSGQFNFPFGIAINASTGNIYVSDRNNFRVQELSASGTFIRMFGYGVSDGATKFEICTVSCRVGLLGSSPGQFYEADGMTIDAAGNVWVVDEVNDRLDEFNEKGEFLHQYGTKGSGNGQLSQPVAITYDNGNLYVTEATNERVQEFSTAGAYVSKFGSEGTGNAQFKIPYAIAAGPSTNDLYVTDRENNRVEIFTASGQFLSSFGSKGKGNAQMELPTGIAATASETLYISDHTNTRIDNWTGLTSRVTKYAYDANSNLESLSDPNGNKTKYTYDADNEPTKVEAANGAITETGYDGAGRIISQTDANKHTTKHVRDILEQVTETIDPLAHKTTKEYDPAGNLTAITDPAKRTTSYTYDAANRLVEIKYSDGKTPTVKYEYDNDGDRTVMTDGTGTSTFTYDQLDRLTEAKDGHGDITKYEYDLASQQTAITYPNGKTVTQAYDKTGRLEKVTDWLSHVTKFAYDPDSNLTSATFPSGTNNEDTYTYNPSDQISTVKMLKGTETLSSLIYSRDSSGQINRTIDGGLPGSEITETVYDANNRLTKAGSTTYEYDPANNPTAIGASTYKYDSAGELENGAGVTYAYDELGERTKATPATGPATTYGYDQAGNLTSVARPKEGTTAAIEDTYGYDGNGLRASQTISGTASYLAWNINSGLSLLLNDGTNSYLYGPGSLPIEQINNTTEKIQYLHHDQAGSTRLITGSTGTIEGAYTYGPYGETTGHTGTATTPLGYDGQYTSSDTGLIYMRARVYDPATAQFLSRDPLAAVSGEPYSYAGDNPVNNSDPTGLLFGINLPSLEEIGEGIAGWGDTITFGGTEWVREQLGDNNISACSSAYQGGGIAGLIIGALIPGEDDAEAAEIAGFTSHGLTQVIGREGVGVSNQALLDAVKDPENIIKQANGTTRYVGKDATVVLNGEKQVVTAWPNSSAGWRTQP